LPRDRIASEMEVKNKHLEEKLEVLQKEILTAGSCPLTETRFVMRGINDVWTRLRLFFVRVFKSVVA